MSEQVNPEPKVDKKPRKKLSQKAKMAINIAFVLAITALVLGLSLKDNFAGIMSAIGVAFSSGKNIAWLLGSVVLVVIVFLLEAFILFLFSRLYTRKFNFGQALGASSVKFFYDNVDPIQSAGKVMQANTLKKQGVPLASSASMVMMSFIVYRTALIVFQVVSLIAKSGEVLSHTVSLFGFEMPIGWVSIVGFVGGLLTIVLPVLLSFSKTLKKLILKGVDLLAKMKIVKNPEKTKEKAQVSIETYRFELKRLFSNIPFTVLVFLLFSLVLFVKGSIPYFTAQALSAVNPNGGFMDFVFLSSFHQMISQIIPTPGQSGAAELFYMFLFRNYYVDSAVQGPAAQILWRSITYTIPLVVTGFVAALYKPNRKSQVVDHTNYNSFINIQLDTYDERKRSSDVLYETTQLNRQKLQERIFGKKFDANPLEGLNIKDETEVIVNFPTNREKPRPTKEIQSRNKPVKEKSKRGYKKIDLSNKDDIISKINDKTPRK